MIGDDELVLVCARITAPLTFPDNRLGKCSECGWKVQFRPHSPRARRVCMECVSDQIDEDTEISITPETLADLREYVRRKKS